MTSVSVKNARSVDAILDKLEQQSNDYYTKVINYAVNQVRNEAILGIQQTPRTGKRYKRGKKTHIASSAGNPPAIDTGRLLNSINYAIKNRYTGEVYASTEYAAALEFGTVRMAARPFMQPALEKSRIKILDLAKKFKYKK
jgi:HK97 gp10 family phage protein